MSDYTVTADAIQMKVSDGTYVHLYKGVTVPENADEDHLKHLIDEGLVAKTGSKAVTEAIAADVGAPNTGMTSPTTDKPESKKAATSESKKDADSK